MCQIVWLNRFTKGAVAQLMKAESGRDFRRELLLCISCHLKSSLLACGLAVKPSQSPPSDFLSSRLL